MDFRGPDRNPGLGIVNDNYMAWRRGELTAAEADARIEAQPANPDFLDGEREEEAEEEPLAFEQAVAAYATLAQAQGWAPIELPTSLGPAPDCVGP